jgi:hypothetical protein
MAIDERRSGDGRYDTRRDGDTTRAREEVMHQETSQRLSHLSHLSAAAKNTKTLRTALIALMFLGNRVANKIYDFQVR